MKIFVVGLGRTGTRSMARALSILGYRSIHWQYTKRVLSYMGWIPIVDYRRLNKYEAYGDIPIARVYKMLDRHFPQARFILTEREPEAWVNSLIRHVGNVQMHHRTDLVRKLYRQLYGVNINNIGNPCQRERLYQAYEKHNSQVKKYFKKKKGKLLVMNLPSGDGWEKLCPFLDRSHPKQSFPWNNRGKP